MSNPVKIECYPLPGLSENDLSRHYCPFAFSLVLSFHQCDDGENGLEEQSLG